MLGIIQKAINFIVKKLDYLTKKNDEIFCALAQFKGHWWISLYIFLELGDSPLYRKKNSLKLKSNSLL